MDNASKNAGDMIGSLQMQYNRGRQASITNELVDIITGLSSFHPFVRGVTNTTLQVPAPCKLGRLFREWNRLCSLAQTCDFSFPQLVNRGLDWLLRGGVHPPSQSLPSPSSQLGSSLRRLGITSRSLGLRLYGLLRMNGLPADGRMDIRTKAL